MDLSACIDKIAKKHGGLRALARAAGCDAGYLSRLRTEQKTEPSNAVLAALGIERVVSYRVSKTPPVPFVKMSKANAAAYHDGEDDGL